jgi:hypothetical protein
MLASREAPVSSAFGSFGGTWTQVHGSLQRDGYQPLLDPNPNSDTCSGGSGANQLFFCEIQS